jgi:hypothetical protein
LIGTSPSATDTPTAIDSLYVLDDPLGEEDREMKGYIQDLVFYSKKLVASEVSQVYGIGIIRPTYSSLSFQASILDYWSLGDESTLSSYLAGETVPNGTTVRSTLGNQNYLTVKENIKRQDGHFLPYYNIMNIALNAAVDPRAHLAALNLHRGGLYGYSSFKQVRSSENPLSRLHKANSIFSYVKESGDYIQQKVGSQLVAFRERRGALTNITESAVISSHKPLIFVGTTSDDDDDATKTRVEIKASFSNENQYFGNEQANRDFGLQYDVVDGYEELTDLYLEGGLDGDSSPIEQFELLKYSQTIYPKAGNSYLDEVRSRKNYTNDFWRDLRANRTETGTIDNGFGFTIPSQSIWPLDVEDNWAARSYGATQGEFTASIPCLLDFNTTSGSASGIEFSVADVHIWAEQAQATPAGTDTTFLEEAGSAPYNYKLRAERFSLNSVAGSVRFWDAWVSALQSANFAQVSHTPLGYVTRSAYSAEQFNNPTEDKYYLQVNPSGFNEANWKTNFDSMMLYCWFRNLSSNSQGYLFREVDSSGVNRRSVYFNGREIELLQSTVFTTLDEDRVSSSPITASTISNGAVRRILRLPLQAGPPFSGGSDLLGREFNNLQMYIYNDPLSNGITDVLFEVNENSQPNSNYSQDIALTDNFDFYSGGKATNTGTSFAYRLKSGYYGLLASQEQLENLATDRSIDFSANNQAVFNFALKPNDRDATSLPIESEAVAQTIFYGDSKPVGTYASPTYLGGTNKEQRNYIWIWMKRYFEAGQIKDMLYVQFGVSYGSGGTANVYNHARIKFDISSYLTSTSKFQQLSVAIIDDPTSPHTTQDVTLRVAVDGNSSGGVTISPSEEIYGDLKTADTDGDGLIEGVQIFPSVGIYNRPITRYSLFGINADNQSTMALDIDSALITTEGRGLGTYYSKEGGVNNYPNFVTDLNQLKYTGYMTSYALDEFVIVNTGASYNGNVDRNIVLNYTGSAYANSANIEAWYRLGDYSDPDFDVLVPLGQTYISEAAGPITDLNLSSSVANIAGVISQPAGFYFEKIAGLNNSIYTPVGYYTSSVSEVYFLCKSGSEENANTDFLHNVTSSDIALFSGTPTIPNNSPKYCWQDLTSSAFTGVQPKIWYTFDPAGDEITENGSFIANSGTLGATYNLTGTYTEGVNRGQFVEGPVVEGSSSFLFKASQPYQGQGTNQAFGSGITNFVSSALAEAEAAENFYLGGSNNASGGAGILMNSYNSFNALTTDTTQTLDSQLYSAPSYARRHSLRGSASFGNPYGIPTNIGPERNLHLNELFQGMAYWDCGTQAGRNPFNDAYAKFIEDERTIAKDYSVVPEFKLSNHIDKYLKTGDTDFEATDNPLFEILGGATNASSSDSSQFYEIYSTSDFLRNFEIIQNDHKGFVDPLSLTLKCKAIKKFLPYDGFYPAERTVNIAEQFYDSYGEHITVSSSFADTTGSVYAKQYLLNPLFSPGILFNTIKSGIACDYPIMTGSFNAQAIDYLGSTTGSYYIDDQFHRRIPFEAIIEPEKYIANVPLGSQEPDPRGIVDANATWNGQGDEKYRMMVSNFLSEVGDFFLENQDYSTIASLPEGDPNFGNAVAGRTYMMRLRMFRSTDGAKSQWVQFPETWIDDGAANRVDGSTIAVPQDTGSSDFRENFTMYSRPSAFGPPQQIALDGTNGDEFNVKFVNWRDYKFNGSNDYFYHPSDNVLIIVASNPAVPTPSSPYEDLQVDSDGHFLYGGNSAEGYNYAFTPPYYHGEAWADFTFVATESKKYTLSEILVSSSVEFLRYYEPIPDAAHPNPSPDIYYTNWRMVNEEAMQLASSMNLRSKGILGQDFESDAVADSYRWIIQSKFETPTLNFNKYRYNSPTNPVTLPYIAAETTPIGMWHQYGELPQNPNEGIFVEVTEVPDNWISNAMGGTPTLTGSLAQLCGFSTNRTRIGEVKTTKKIKEAVVAVPFIEKSGERQFFNISREDINNALSEDNRNLVGDTINNMVDNMKEFIIPPSMDFVNNSDIDPFAMYIFVFEHTLTKQDLANIWQNVAPDISITSEQAEATISHELLNHELLGAGAELKPGVNKKLDLNKDSRNNEINSEIKWLVFKAKQRASANYFEKIYERNESKIARSTRPTVGSTGMNSKIQYNWPYDFFSLVELVKIDAEVNFAQPDQTSDETGVTIEPIVKNPDNISKRKGSKGKRKQTIKSKKR